MSSTTLFDRRYRLEERIARTNGDHHGPGKAGKVGHPGKPAAGGGKVSGHGRGHG